MLLIRCRIGVACCTGIDRIVVRVSMTFRTLIPYPVMCATIDREILVVMVAELGFGDRADSVWHNAHSLLKS